jgi:hypothetical protein
MFMTRSAAKRCLWWKTWNHLPLTQASRKTLALKASEKMKSKKTNAKPTSSSSESED